MSKGSGLIFYWAGFSATSEHLYADGWVIDFLHEYEDVVITHKKYGRWEGQVNHINEVHLTCDDMIIADCPDNIPKLFDVIRKLQSKYSKKPSRPKAEVFDIETELRL